MKTLANAPDCKSILDRLEMLRPDSPRRWGRMTPHQMICHLSDSFRVGLGVKRVTLVTGPLQQTLVKWIALWAPLPWPKGLPTMPEMKQGVGGTPPVEFERDRNDLARVIGKFSENSTELLPGSHPLFGTMRRDEWLRWGYLHTDHHFRQFSV